jgi:hypothetical protein
MKIGVLAADEFQDSEYFLPKIEIEKLGLETEVISLSRAPIEIYSFFSRIGLLDVQKTIDEVGKCPSCHLRGMGCSMLTRLSSVSTNETYWPMPGISIGSPGTVPPAPRHFPDHVLNVIDRDDEGRALHRPVGLSRVKPTIDGAWLLVTALQDAAGFSLRRPHMKRTWTASSGRLVSLEAVRHVRVASLAI